MNLQIPEIDYSTAPGVIRTHLKANVPLLIQGAPGIGKTQIVKAEVEKWGEAEFFDLLVSDPAQCGVPVSEVQLAMAIALLSPEKEKAKYLQRFIDIAGGSPTRSFWTRTSSVPLGGANKCVMLDELGQSSPSRQAMAMRVALEKKFGEHQLDPETRVIAMTNRQTDGAGVGKMNTALMDRFSRYQLNFALHPWCQWGMKTGRINPYVCTWGMELGAGQINNFNPEAEQCPTPRSWEWASMLMAEAPDTEWQTLIGGRVGCGAAADFMSFYKMKDDVPDISLIIKNPDSATVPNDPSLMWLVAAALVGAVCKKDGQDYVHDLSAVDRVVGYALRLQGAVQAMILRGIGPNRHDFMNSYLESTATGSTPYPNIDKFVTANADVIAKMSV